MTTTTLLHEILSAFLDGSGWWMAVQEGFSWTGAAPTSAELAAGAPPSIGERWDAVAAAIESRLSSRGLGACLRLLLLTALLLLVARLLDRPMEELENRGLIPRSLDLTRAMLRVLASIAALFGILAITPSALLPLVPLVLTALTLGIGWAAAYMTPDFIAGISLLMEGQVRPGTRINTAGTTGIVSWVGLRSTLLRDAEGRQVAVPNRLLLSQTVMIDADHRPEVELIVRIPNSVSPTEARHRLHEAAMLSPWRAAGTTPLVVRHGDAPNEWRLETRLINIRFAPQFEEALRELVEETFDNEPEA